MKNIFLKLEKSMMLILKILLYVSLLAIFLGILAIENRPVLRLSRTMGITISTFIITGFLFSKTYGQFDIGRRKSKPIIYSLGLAIFLTDLVTYFQLMIMNTISPNVSAFRLTSIKLLIFVIILQLLDIMLFTYGGNAIYFYIHEPEKCCIVVSSKEGLNRIAKGIIKYKKQYKIEYVIDYKNRELIPTLDKVDTVFMYNIPYAERGEIISYCYENQKNIYYNPEIVDIVETNAEGYLLDDITLINYNGHELSIEQKFMKRILDLVLVIMFGVLSSPIWIISAVIIKVYDGGSVLFKQKRATLHGKVFEVYKFRTMKENVENRSVTKDDDRITAPGRVLRKIRMDELPQLLNILKGDMSFVGPRPEMLENVNAYTEELPEFKYRLQAKAGLTGYAQISGKYSTSPKDKLMMDMQYIENYSLWKDIQLIFQTVIVLLKSDSTEAFDENWEFQWVENEKGEEDEKV